MNFQKNDFGDDGDSSLNLTSLIDVMFLLVIFFAVSTTFQVYPGLSIKLPAANSEKIVKEKRGFTAILTEKGDIYLDGKPVKRENFRETLRRKKIWSSATMLVLKADAKAEHGQVVELMDIARQVGIPRLAIATRQKDDADRIKDGVEKTPN